MSAGRIGVYVLILGASLVSARFLSRKHGRAHDGAAQPAVPKTASAEVAAPVAPSGSFEPPGVSAPVAAPSGNEVLSEALCPADMVWVGAQTCATYERTCAKKQGDACVAFEPAGCKPGQKLKFCIDRYEYPNEIGMVPATVVTFAQARTACEAEGKRLCSEAEWALACEGPSGLAFPYGNELDPNACNVGHPLPRMPVDALWEPRDVSGAVAKVDARVPSGEKTGCVSPLGAHDMTGNVEEWVTSVTGYHGALRGGGYPDSAPSCRTVRQLRDPSYRSVATGFRCCRDPLVRSGPPPRAAGPRENPSALPSKPSDS